MYVTGRGMPHPGVGLLPGSLLSREVADAVRAAFGNALMVEAGAVRWRLGLD